MLTLWRPFGIRVLVNFLLYFDHFFARASVLYTKIKKVQQLTITSRRRRVLIDVGEDEPPVSASSTRRSVPFDPIPNHRKGNAGAAAVEVDKTGQFSHHNIEAAIAASSSSMMKDDPSTTKKTTNFRAERLARRSDSSNDEGEDGIDDDDSSEKPGAVFVPGMRAAVVPSSSDFTLTVQQNDQPFMTMTDNSDVEIQQQVNIPLAAEISDDIVEERDKLRRQLEEVERQQHKAGAGSGNDNKPPILVESTPVVESEVCGIELTKTRICISILVTIVIACIAIAVPMSISLNKRSSDISNSDTSNNSDAEIANSPTSNISDDPFADPAPQDDLTITTTASTTSPTINPTPLDSTITTTATTSPTIKQDPEPQHDEEMITVDCGGHPCLVPIIGLSCSEMIEEYYFQGSCCSLEEQTVVSLDPPGLVTSCYVTISAAGYCFWSPKCGICDPNKGGCDAIYATSSPQDCPESQFDALASKPTSFCSREPPPVTVVGSSPGMNNSVPTEPPTNLVTSEAGRNPSPVLFCGDAPCIIPIAGISCAQLMEEYDFFGSCCSLKDIVVTGDCQVTVAQRGVCLWTPKCDSTPCNSTVGCNIEYQTYSQEECPESQFDPLNGIPPSSSPPCAPT